MILIRTRPRGAEVKASFLLDVSTKAPSAFARTYTRDAHVRIIRIYEAHFRGALVKGLLFFPLFSEYLQMNIVEFSNFPRQLISTSNSREFVYSRYYETSYYYTQ